MAISRATLSDEFYDRASQIMLKQPEPQYLYAGLVYMAEAQAQLQRAQALGISPDRAIAALGASVPGFDDQRLMLADNIRSEAIMTTQELAKGTVGHTIRFNRPVFSGGGYTEAARTIAGSSSISTVPVDLTQEQVALTIKRVGGPYDSANSRVAPRAVDRLDSEHAVHSIAQIVGVDLARDRMKYLDTVVAGDFDTCSVIVFPGDASFALTADTSAFTGINGDRPFDVETIFRAEQKLQDAYIPRFANGTYMAIITTQQARQLRSDPQFGRLAVFQPENNPLKRTFVGQIGQVEIYVSSTNTVDTTTVSGTSINHGIMFGPGHVCYASAGPCRVAASTDDNYGETAKVIWLTYEGHTVLDNRFAVAMHSN